MKKISSFKEYSYEKALLENYTYYISCGELMESSFLDRVKNKMSKTILGSLSYVKMIDELVEKVESLEKEKIDKRYKFKEEILKLEMKVSEARKSKSLNFIKSLSSQLDSKKEEFSRFEEAQDLKIKKGLSLIDKAVGNNTRRKDYAKAKSDDLDLSIAEYEYNVAKKRSSSPKELERLENELEKARKEAEESIKKFDSKISSESGQESKKYDPKSPEGVEINKERKIISSDNPKDLLERKKNLRQIIAKLESDLENRLNMLEDKLENSATVSRKYIESQKSDLLEIGNELDSSRNLLKIYQGFDQKPEGSENTEEMFNQITSSILDGFDFNSGSTKKILDLFNQISGDSKDAYKKIKSHKKLIVK